MKERTIYSIALLTIFLFLLVSFTDKEDQENEFVDKAKIALRQVGNELLLLDNDSTSTVQPVLAINETSFEISFETPLSFLPDDLVAVVEKNMQKSALPNTYRVSVIQCTDQETAYSYEMAATEERTIIPCLGRKLSTNCYLIRINFLANKASAFSRKTIALVLIGILLILLFFGIRSNRKAHTLYAPNTDYISVGNFKFYEEQNKLVKEAEEISLSKKECELLAIFVANPNQIIKREELTKKVWEDNGVFVGRSLDTYISKLRKKLQDDPTIQITNVHGVGYRLELQ